jgi:hypothetical protein
MAVSIESIQYKVTTSVISSMKMEVGKSKNKMAPYWLLLAGEVTAII